MSLANPLLTGRRRLGIILPAIYARNWTGEPQTAGTVADGILPVPFHSKTKSWHERCQLFLRRFPMLLIGNLVALVGSLLMVSIGFIKDKKKS
ncbi:MAG: hypothetical protein LUC35_05550 [Clostridiales bacterium]|nr:hypothetical protein [Clostridiales bacterium]